MIDEKKLKEYRNVSYKVMCTPKYLEECFHTIEALLEIARCAEKMQVRMKLINGPDEKCIYVSSFGDGSMFCANHAVIREMDEALKPVAAEGEGRK